MSDDDLDQTQSEWDEVMASQEFRNALQEWEARNRGRDPRDPAFEAPDCPKCRDSGELPNGDICPDCCPHDEHDHGICLDCSKDIWNDIVASAEFRADCLEDR